MDKIVQGNTSNIIFLKSTDDAMIETLSKMSGTTHVVRKDSKTVSYDAGAFTRATANDAKLGYNISVKEEPVISYNDMAQIPPCNSIVFRAGDSPIWNRNETALPMSWRLFKNTITNPGKEYTLQTIPSLSTAKDFDVKQNQPNFMKMFEKRLNQAAKAEKAMQYYQDAYGLTDDQIQKLDIDVYADGIMELISQMLNPDLDLTKREEHADPSVLDVEPEQSAYTKTAKKDDTVTNAMAADPEIAKEKENDRKIYAEKTISRNDLVSRNGVNHSLDAIISDIYAKNRNYFARDPNWFRVDPQTSELRGTDGKVYIHQRDHSEDLASLEEDSKKPTSRVHGLDDGTERRVRNDLVVEDAFYKFLVSFDGEWPFANGEFAREMARAQANGNI